MNRSNAVQKRRGAVTTWIVVGLVLAAGAAVSYMAFSGSTQEGSGTVVSVRNSGTADIVRAQRQPFEISTVANGELDARRRAEYRNPLDQASTIVDVVPEGTRVSAGDLLIQLNVEEIQLKVDEESLRVEAARAELVAAQNNVEIQRNENDSRLRQAELKHLLAELALAQWKDGDVQKKRRELQLDIDRATLELERLAQLYLRSQDLHAEGFLSKDQMDRDEVQYIEAIARFKTSKLSREVYESFEYVKDEKKYLSDVEESRAEINRVRLNSESELANKLAQLENRRRQLFELESRLAKLERQRDDATIRASRTAWSSTPQPSTVRWAAAVAAAAAETPPADRHAGLPEPVAHHPARHHRDDGQPARAREHVWPRPSGTTRARARRCGGRGCL